MVEEANPKVTEGPSREKPKSEEQRAKKNAYQRDYNKRKREERKTAEIEVGAQRVERRIRRQHLKKMETMQEAPVPADDGDFLQGHIPDGPVWEPAVDVKTGLDREERETIDLALKLDQVEKRIQEAAIPKDTRKMILQEIQVDSNNKIRRYVELTPSMCDVRGCGFDAAKEAGATDWNNAPVNQPMPNGKTIGQRLIELKEYHKATAHTNASLNDHIITADEMNKRTWGIGQDIRGDFLTGAR